jgi:hypothetical protein
MTMTKVWIELERPTPEEGDEVGEQRAKLANKMLRKLGVPHDVFSWWPNDPDKRRYIRTVCPESGAFTWLSDNGDWFDLEKLAK